MIKNLMIILTFALLLAAPAMAANVTAVEIHGVVFDSSKTYNTTSFVWDAQNFTGFWYASGSGKSSETLTINQLTESLKVNNRMIQQENLLYNTSRTDTNYTLYTETGKKVDYGLSTGYIKGATGGKYAQLGWFGDIYVAVNGKANKLTKLIKSQKKDEKQTLKLGTSWNLGEGYNLTVESLDPETSPRQALLNFTKDGKTIDNKVVNEGEVYTYVEKSVSGESNVPVFVTYVESIFKGGEGMSALVQLRYTWLISQNVLEIKAGDKFGVFEVKEANENYVLLYNKEKTINLDQNTVQMLYGDLKFRVADSSTALRFYPILEKKAPGKYEVRGGTYDQKIFTNLVWDAQRFPGFWYALGSGKSSEKLSIVNQNATSLTFSSRVIQQENLLYNTSRTDTNYTLYTETGKKVDYGLSTGYIKGATGGKYAQLGWFGDIYVAVNGKANKLTKLIKSQKKDEKQTLKLGTSWNLGEGYNLTVESLDPETSPRQALLNFTKDGKTIDSKVVFEGEVYTYVEKSVSGESNVLVFVTYVESIFKGEEGMSALVQLRYTWLISQNVIEIKAGDKFGVFEVKEANENYVLLHNKDKSINLDQNTVQQLYKELKFKVADSSTALRFYPLFEHTILPPKVEVNATSATTTNAPTATVTAVATPASAAQPSSLNAAAPSGTLQPNLAQTEAPVKTEADTAKPAQWNWVLYAIAGFVAIVYLAKRRV